MVLDQSALGTVPSDMKFPANKLSALTSFKKLSDEEVRALVTKSAKSYCALDPMPMTLLLDCLDEVLPVTSYLVNSSLVHGYFPRDWKEALVKPLLKKSGLEVQFKNLRPISNLQFISKLAERSAYKQTHDHLITHNLIPELQSAYRKRYSIETALLKVQNDILLNMDRQYVTLLVLLDLSSAFDTVNHEILLRRLETTFGITGTALQWFSSYLGNHSQRVVFGDGVSESFYLACGVPQGSCLGPLLFTLYSSKLFVVIKHHLPSAHAYADDTQLYISFKPDCSASEADCFSAMEKCIRAVRAWMIQDKMKLNDDKTEFLIIGTSQHLKKVCIDTLSVSDAIISPVLHVHVSARNLGAYFDSNMTLVPFINNTCKSAFSQLYNIRRIRKYLTTDTSKTLVHAMITCRIDYCNSLLCGLPDNSLNKLQRVQNAAAQLITGTAKFSHMIRCSAPFTGFP